MSIRFPSDDNAGMPGHNAPRRRSGGGLFFLMFLGVVAFMLMRSVNSGPAAPTDSNPVDRGGVTQYPDLQQPAERADQDDWGLEDGPVQRNASSKTPSSGSSNAKSSSGDWGMDRVTTTKKKPAAQGDWGLDTDVDKGSQPAVPKKTTQGDWGLEQVD